MPCCFVPGCRSGYRNFKEERFFKPKDKETLMKWKKAIPRKDRELTEKSVICDIHFSEEFITKSVKFMIEGKEVEISRQNWYLKPNSVPHIFPNLLKYFTTKLKQRKSSRRRNLEEMDTDDWTEKLIETVQSKPALYNKAMKEYSDRNLIAQLWTEVCQTMVENWYKLTPEEKILKGKEIQQRWRNLRTCFNRELNKQRKIKSGQATKKRRKYIYFDQLLFLLPTLSERKTVNETSPSAPNGEESKDEEQQINKEPILFEQRHSTKQKKNKTLSYEESLLNILKHKKTEEIDEDKSFLLSLVPSFKRLTDDQKIEAKLEFLKIIRRISHPKRYASA